MSEQVQNIFFSKDNIAELNKTILEKTNMHNLNREGKQEFITLLVKNMKIVYKSIDSSKINNTNLSSILQQFKKHSLIEAMNDINKNNIVDKYNNSAALKFNRDFSSNPNKGNQLQDRPQATKMVNTYMPPVNTSLDDAFKPIIGNDMANSFNMYQDNKNAQNRVNIDDFQNSRNSAIGLNKERPKTPDFLKPKMTNPTKNPENKQSINTNTNTNNNTTLKNDHPDGYFGLANDTGGDLFSLDNIDKPLIETEYIEDSSNFEERLKRLHSDRTSVNIKPHAGQIDFTSDTFKSSNINDNSVPSIQKNQQVEQPMMQQQMPKQQIPKQQMMQQQMMQQQSPQYYDDTLQIKQNELLLKEQELQEKINRYNKLLEPRILYLEVADTNNQSSYSFPFVPIDNINSIKLTNYSLPKINFNIEENKNNMLLLRKNNNDIQIVIKKGFYTIENLIDTLNSKMDNIKLSLTLEQTIKIESTDNEQFNLIQTNLSKFNLGFINECSNNTNYTSDNIWDLRIDNKVYLYITNLSDTIPFGILFHNGESNSEFKFEEPISLNNLDIVFKDSKGYDYNFYNLSHSLSFSLSTN